MKNKHFHQHFGGAYLEIRAFDSDGTLTEPSPRLAWIKDISAGCRVALILENGPTLATALLELFIRGAVSVPINPRSHADQIAFITTHADPHFIFDGEQLIAREEAGPYCTNHERFLIYTSGSTGNPKAVMLTESAVRHNAQAVAELHRFRPDRPHATCLPLFHCNALMMSLLGCYYTDTPLILLNRFDPQTYFNLIEREAVKTASIVPALLSQLLQTAPEWPPSLEYLITAASPLYRAQAARFFDLYGARLRQGYGMTEAVNFSFVMPLLDAESFRKQYLEHWPPVGLPLPGTEFRLKNQEVEIRGPNLMTGYWKNPDATRDAFTPDGWLKTGDTGYIRDGYLVLNGRIKEVINRGGEKFYPVDVEQQWQFAFKTKPGNFAAFAVPHNQLHEDFGLWIESPDSDTIRKLRSQSKLKPCFIQTGPFPVTSTGKFMRRRMSASAAAWVASQEDYEEYQAWCNQSDNRSPPLRESLTGSLRNLIARQVDGIEHYQLEMLDIDGCRIDGIGNDQSRCLSVIPQQISNALNFAEHLDSTPAGHRVYGTVIARATAANPPTDWCDDTVTELTRWLDHWGVSLLRYGHHIIACLYWGNTRGQ